MDSVTLFAIIAVIVIVAVLTAVVIAIEMVANKATDSIRNKITRSRAKMDPPKQENLSDRYNTK